MRVQGELSSEIKVKTVKIQLAEVPNSEVMQVIPYNNLWNEQEIVGFGEHFASTYVREYFCCTGKRAEIHVDLVSLSPLPPACRRQVAWFLHEAGERFFYC